MRRAQWSPFEPISAEPSPTKSFSSDTQPSPAQASHVQSSLFGSAEASQAQLNPTSLPSQADPSPAELSLNYSVLGEASRANSSHA